MTDDSSLKPWQQLPDEPHQWYDRFEIYLRLGPSRTITAAYRIWASSQGRPSKTARERAEEWRWQERAIAWDKANRKEKAALETARSAESRERNLRLNSKIFEAISAVFETADLTNLTKEEARDILPSLRGYLRTASELQRRELPSPLDIDQLDASDGWPVLDPVAERILDSYVADEDKEKNT